MRLSVVLPAYNEEDTIEAILRAVRGADLSALPQPIDMEVIVVDDASTDRTAEIIAEHSDVKLIRHETNRGKGAAIRTAIAHTTGDVILIQDADMEYFVSDYTALLRPFVESDAQVVYGSRFLKRRRPTGMHFANYIANRMLTFLANLLFNAKITDEATCFKVFEAKLLKSLPLRAQRFDFCPEVTALVRLRGVPIREVPIDYKARSRAEGKKVMWTDGIAAVKTLVAYRLRGARSAQ